jgi:hypothetical protein
MDDHRTQPGLFCWMTLVCLFLLTVASFIAGPSSAQREAPGVAVKWEYKRLNDLPAEEGLNELGSQGWELFLAVGKVQNTITDRSYFYLKRPRR